jgi:uncharacterized protein
MNRSIPVAALAAAGLGLLLAAPAEAASFNCARASLPAEMAICNSPGLGEMDQEMAALYFNLVNYGPAWAVRQIKGEQSNWIARRNGCGYDRRCVGAAYDRRIGRLRDWQDRLGM